MSHSTPNPRPSSGTDRPPRISAREVDELLRLPNFLFTSRHVLTKPYKHAAYALGAITKNKRLGKQAVVTKNLTIVFESAVEVRKQYPTMKIEVSWKAILQEIKNRDATIAAPLDDDSLRHVVLSYASAFHLARRDGLHGAVGGMALKQKDEKGPEEPRTRLLTCVDSVESWITSGNKTPYLPSFPDEPGSINNKNKSESANDSQAMPSIYPSQVSGETDKEYISRLQDTVMKLVDTQRLSHESLTLVVDDDNEEIKTMSGKITQLKSTVKKQNNIIAEMSDEMDKMEAELKEKEDELKEKDKKIEDLELGGSEDEPWIPWRVYAERNGW